MIFIHIESILNVNEFNYNLPNYCYLVTIKKIIGMNNKEHALGSAAWLVQELSQINQNF